jgi:hypothetical protein
MGLFGTKTDNNFKVESKELIESFKGLHKDRVSCQVILKKGCYKGIVTQVFNDHIWFIAKDDENSKHVIIPFVSIISIEIN